LYRGKGDLGISVSPKASSEGAKSRAYTRGGPKASSEGKARSFSKFQNLYRGESSEFFQVPELVYGVGDLGIF